MQGPKLVDTIVDKDLLVLESLVKSTILQLGILIPTPNVLPTVDKEVERTTLKPDTLYLPFNGISSYVAVFKIGSQDNYQDLYTLELPWKWLSPSVPKLTKDRAFVEYDIKFDYQAFNATINLYRKEVFRGFIPQRDRKNQEIKDTYPLIEAGQVVKGTFELESTIDEIVLIVNARFPSDPFNKAVIINSVTYYVIIV